MNRNRRAVLRAIVGGRIPTRPVKSISVTQIHILTGLSKECVKQHVRALHADGFITLDRPYRGIPYQFTIHSKSFEEVRCYGFSTLSGMD